MKIIKVFMYKIVNILLSISFNVCFGCSKEPSHYHLSEMVLLSTHNICFGGEIRKIIFDYVILSRGQYYLCCSNWTSKKFSLFVSIAEDLAKFLWVKLRIFSYPSVLTYVLGAQKNHLNETVLLSTHNIYFRWRNKTNKF